VTKFLEEARVITNRMVAPGIWSMRLTAPRLAEAAAPGQFVQVQLGDSGHALRRPISIYQADTGRGEIRLLYQTVGVGTRLMATWQADRRCSLLGPLGVSWPVPEDAHRMLLIGGGIGTAPLAMLTQQLKTRIATHVTMIQAAQTAERLVARDFFEPLVDTWICATDDGSEGARGLITGPLVTLLESTVRQEPAAAAEPEQEPEQEQEPEPEQTPEQEQAPAPERFDVAYVCGPEVMQIPVAQLCADYGLRCYVSLERRMACGIGACLGCVVKTKSGLQKVCQTGPIFNAEEVCWNDNVASRAR